MNRYLIIPLLLLCGCSEIDDGIQGHWSNMGTRRLAIDGDTIQWGMITSGGSTLWGRRIPYVVNGSNSDTGYVSLKTQGNDILIQYNDNLDQIIVGGQWFSRYNNTD